MVRATKDDFADDYWKRSGAGTRTAAIDTSPPISPTLDLSDFDPKAPPPKTAAFWDIVDANRAPEDAELADVLDELGNPDATTLVRITNAGARGDFADWLEDRKNRRVIPHRLERCGYVPVRNDSRPGRSLEDQRQTAGRLRQEAPCPSRTERPLALPNGWPHRSVKSVKSVKISFHYPPIYAKKTLTFKKRRG